MYYGCKKNKRVVIVVVWKEVAIKEVLETDMGAVTNKDMEEGEAYPALDLIVEKLVMYQFFVPNRVLFMGTIIAPGISHKTVSTY
jgi:hypothetical protein